jgi:hypothetical protein
LLLSTRIFVSDCWRNLFAGAIPVGAAAREHHGSVTTNRPVRTRTTASRNGSARRSQRPFNAMNSNGEALGTLRRRSHLHSPVWGISASFDRRPIQEVVPVSDVREPSGS